MSEAHVPSPTAGGAGRTSRPVIGLLAAFEEGRFGEWVEVADVLPRTYSTAVQRAGGLALLVPVDQRTVDQPDEVLDLVDGLILAGGGDVDPASYGVERHPETRDTNPLRDRAELALGRRALERDIPLLGVCRGLQIINVIAGGTLHQHLPEVLGHDDHRTLPASFADHRVRLREGSLAARAIGATETDVKSHHHQAPDRLGESVVVSGWAESDDLVEAIELPQQRFALGVLWHPEEDETSHVVAALVNAARARAHAREKQSTT